MSLTLKENTISFFYYILIVEIPTNKGANSFKLKNSIIGNNKFQLNEISLYLSLAPVLLLTHIPDFRIKANAIPPPIRTNGMIVASAIIAVMLKESTEDPEASGSL